MTHGSLFSGIGGFDYAADLMGWENLFHCEWNPFGQKVLHYYWPNAHQFTDITKSDFTPYADRIDVLTGGFPCQPYSSAGKRLGKEDERHLWPEMLRAVREIRPRWIVGENVLGLINWNGGLVFHEVQTDLETEGYEVQPFVLPACAINAPHRRDRVWFIAHCDRFRCDMRGFEGQGVSGRQQARNEADSSGQTITYSHSFGCSESEANNGGSDSGWISGSPIQHSQQRSFANTDGIGLERGISSREHDQSERGFQEGGKIGEYLHENRESPIRFEQFPTQPPLCSRNDGLSSELDGITFSKWREESIKAGGNAVVPGIVLQIFKAIQQYAF